MAAKLSWVDPASFAAMESDTHFLYFTKLSGKSRDFYFLVGIHLKIKGVCWHRTWHGVWLMCNTIEISDTTAAFTQSRAWDSVKSILSHDSDCHEQFSLQNMNPKNQWYMDYYTAVVYDSCLPCKCQCRAVGRAAECPMTDVLQVASWVSTASRLTFSNIIVPNDK